MASSQKTCLYVLVVGAMKYPDIYRVWYPGVCLGLSVLFMGISGILATHQAFISLSYRHGCISVTFLVSCIIALLFSCVTMICSAVYFPIVLDDRIDNLQSLKSIIIIMYLVSFVIALIEAVSALRCYYAYQFERLMDSQLIEISPLNASSRTEPFLLAKTDSQIDGLFMSSKRKTEGILDVQTFIGRSNPGYSDDEDATNQLLASDVKEL